MKPTTKSKILLFLRLFGESLCLPYISLFLSGKGLTEAQLGIIIGLIPLTSLACTPLYAKFFNTPKRAKNALSVMGAIEAALVVALLFCNGNFAAAIVIIILISVTSSSNYGLLDSLLGLICSESGNKFGTVRIFGSIAYLTGSAFCFGAGLLIKKIGGFLLYELTFPFAAAMYVTVSVIFILVKAPEAPEKSGERVTIKSILGNGRFMGYVLFYVLMIGSMQVCDDFYSLYLVSKGNPDYYYSVVMLGFVAVEIATILIMNKLAKPELKYLFAACSVLIVRRIVQSLPFLPTWALIASQLPRGITWGIALFVSTPHIIKILGFEKSTTGIVLCWFFLAAFTSVFKLCGGYIIAAIGYPYFYTIFAVLAAADLVYFIFYSRRAEKNTTPADSGQNV